MKLNELQAVKNNVIAEPITEKVTEGGLFIPETANTQDPQVVCTVISIGPGAAEEIQGANKIICHPQAGLAMFVDGKAIKVVKDDEIYAVLKERKVGEQTAVQQNAFDALSGVSKGDK